MIWIDQPKTTSQRIPRITGGSRWQAIERLTSCFRFPNHRSDPVPRFLVLGQGDAQEVCALEFDEFVLARRVVGVSSYRSDESLKPTIVASLGAFR